MAFTTYEQGFGVKNNLGSTGKLQKTTDTSSVNRLGA